MALPWRLPLMQAPLGPAATPELVARVSAAGALGTLAASWTPLGELRDQVRLLRRTGDPFCVNLVLAFDQTQRLDLILAEGVTVVSFSWGIDRELIAIAHAAGAFVLVQVGEVREAGPAVDAGADALIVQGAEAGGHVQAKESLDALLPAIRRQARVPILAAGGIADRSRIEAVRHAGADAVVCGTVFLAADEADVHPTYLDRLIASTASDTVLTTVFDGGWPNAPHRVLRNGTLAAWERAGKPPAGKRPGEHVQVASRRGLRVLRYDDAQPTRDTVGEVELMAMYAGTSTEAIAKREPAARIVSRLSA